MALFNKSNSKIQEQRRDYEFYIGLCFEVQQNIFNDHIFTEPLEKDPLINKKSFENLLLNAMLLTITIKKTFRYENTLFDIWKDKDEALKKVMSNFALIMTKNPNFSMMYREYDDFKPSHPLIAGMLYLQGRFFDYGDFLESYFTEEFQPCEEDPEDEYAPHDLETYKAMMIRYVYDYYMQPFCKYPQDDLSIDIDERDNLVNDFEEMVNNAYMYFSSRLLTGKF